MNRRAWTGTCAAVVSLATAGVLAQTAPQTAPQTTPQPPTAQSAPSSSANKITVTGCLKAAPTASTDTAGAANANPAATTGTAGSTAPATAGTSGTSGTGTTAAGAGAEAKFILTAATTTPAAGDATSGATSGGTTSGSTGGATANAAGTAQTYRLIANPTALSDHVGKKLELTGTIDTTSAADPKDPSAAAPALRVESGKIVAASCP